MVCQTYHSMVCVRVAFRENDENHENDKNDEDNSDSYKRGVEPWIRGNHGNRENDESHGNPGCKPRVPQTTGLETTRDFLVLFSFPSDCRIFSTLAGVDKRMVFVLADVPPER